MKLLYFFLQPAIQWAIWSNCDLPCLETNVQLYSSQSDSQIHTLAHKHTHTHYLSLSLSLSRTHKYTHLLFLFHALTDTHTHTYTHKTSYIVFWKGVEFCSNASYNRWLRMKFLDNVATWLFELSQQNAVSQGFIMAALRRAFYACVYCMQLRFQRKYVGCLKPR